MASIHEMLIARGFEITSQSAGCTCYARGIELVEVYPIDRAEPGWVHYHDIGSMAAAAGHGASELWDILIAG